MLLNIFFEFHNIVFLARTNLLSDLVDSCQGQKLKMPFHYGLEGTVICTEHVLCSLSRISDLLFGQTEE